MFANYLFGDFKQSRIQKVIDSFTFLTQLALIKSKDEKENHDSSNTSNLLNINDFQQIELIGLFIQKLKENNFQRQRHFFSCVFGRA